MSILCFDLFVCFVVKYLALNGKNSGTGILTPCIFESLPFPDAVSNFPAHNEKDPQKHGDTPQIVPVPGKKSPALTKMDSAFECGLFPPSVVGDHADKALCFWQVPGDEVLPHIKNLPANGRH
jgi:hypothetical protein